MAFGFSSIKVTALDLSPNYSGSVMALVNCIGCVSGILTPYVVGLLTPHVSILIFLSILTLISVRITDIARLQRSAEEWRMVFWLMALITISTNFIFVVFGSCSLQSWNNVDDDDQTDTNTLKMGT